MSSRQARWLVSVLAATMVIVFFLYQPDFELSYNAVLRTQHNNPESPASTEESSSSGETSKVVDVATVTSQLDPTAQSSPEQSESAIPEADGTGQELDFIDWKRFAYAQYVTNSEYLCNAVMVFETLHRLGSRASRLLMYPKFMMRDPTTKEANGYSKKLLIKARDEFGVSIVPIEIQHREHEDLTWADSYTKLLAFNQTQYDRILAFDSDALLLKTMDELFLMPSCPIAMPRAYWLMRDKPPKKILSTHIMLLEPSNSEFERLQHLTEVAKDDEFDMELVNKLYQNSAAVLPHRPYGLLSAEFRSNTHELYLGSKEERWNPKAAFEEAKLIHFSDWPVPKPWLDLDDEEGLRAKHQPHCRKYKNKPKNCDDRDIWNSLYAEFQQRRDSTCGG